MIRFNQSELEIIERNSIVGGWESPEAAEVKEKIVSYLRDQINSCCYCQTSMHGWHNISKDPEHILPKRHFPKFIFALPNLSVACKRCNMQIKNQDYAFFSEGLGCVTPFNSSFYSIVHPNLDNYFDHIEIYSEVANGTLVTIYFPIEGSAKGKATYEYFQLEKLEVYKLNLAQGLPEEELLTLPEISQQALKALEQQ